MPHAYQFDQTKNILRQLGKLSNDQLFVSKELTGFFRCGFCGDD